MAILQQAGKIFLQNSLGSNEFSLITLPSDASARVYFRVRNKNSNYILMDSSKELSSVKPYIQITELLHKQNLRAPKITAKYLENGFLLLEDFGNQKLNLILNSDNQEFLYKKLIDVLVDIKKYDRNWIENNSNYLFPRNFVDYTVNELNAFIDWYIPYISGKNLPVSKKEEFLEYWKKILGDQPSLGEVLTLADYHVDNLIFLDNGEIGLLDFQDAIIGWPAYDLVSLLQDVRRKIDFDFAEKMIEYYLEKTGLNAEIFKAHYHILGVQRNLRILGFFVRKQLRDNNSNYLKYIPLLKEYIKYSLNHSICKNLKPLTDLYL